MEWPPSARALVVNVACPPPLSVPVPSVAAPSLNVIVPVAVTPDTVTEAVNVTAAPTAPGLAEDATAVVLEFWFTVSVCTADVLPV
jgi:hypothetical protein